METVDSYLSTVPSIVTTTNIQNVSDLEQTISEELKSVTRRKPSRTHLNKSKVHESDKDESKTEKNPQNIFEQNPSKIEIDNLNPWTMIGTFQIVENEESNEDKKMRAVRKQEDMASALHDQIELKNKAVKKEKDEDDKFVSIQRQAIKVWEEEQKLSAKIEQGKIAELKRVRQDQVEETERKKKAELSKKISTELKEIEEIKSALYEEEELKHKRKLLEREKWDRITIENAKKLEIRKLEKEKEARMDAKLMEDMKAKYVAEERKREKAMEDRKIKLEANGQLLSEAGAFNKREEMIKFEKKLLEAAEAREKAQALKERKKKDLERKKKNQITESNKLMAEERRRREREIEKENEAYAIKCLKEKEALLEEEEEKRVKQHENKVKYRKILQEQMEEQKQNVAQFDGMTQVERSMNKKVSEINAYTHRRRIFCFNFSFC